MWVHFDSCIEEGFVICGSSSYVIPPSFWSIIIWGFNSDQEHTEMHRINDHMTEIVKLLSISISKDKELIMPWMFDLQAEGKISVQTTEISNVLSLNKRFISEILCTCVFSSAGSDYTPSPLPPVTGNTGTGQLGQLTSLPPPAVLFPPITGPSKELLGSSKYLSRYV